MFLRDILVIFLAALLISFLVKTFLIRSFYIPSGSMENTLQIDDRIIVNELVPDVVDVQRGDVVVFTDPGGWLDGTAPVTTVSATRSPTVSRGSSPRSVSARATATTTSSSGSSGCRATPSPAATTSGR